MKNKNKFFYQLWGKQFLFIFIPALIVMSFAIAFSAAFEREIISNHQDTTMNAIEAIDEKLENLGKISYQIVSTPSVQSISKIEKNENSSYYYDIWMGRKAFSKYKGTYEFGNILLYFPNNNIALSSNSLCTDAKRFYNSLFQFDTLSYKDFTEKICKPQTSFATTNVLPYHSIKLGLDRYEGIIFRYQSSPPNQEAPSIIMFNMVDKAYIQQLFAPLLEKQGQINITDTNDNVIYSINHDLTPTQDYATMKKAKEDYIITERTSRMGLTYHCYVPRKVVLKEINLLNVLAMCISVLSMLGVLLLFTRDCLKNSRIVRNIEKLSGNAAWEKNQSLFEAINDAVFEVVQDNQELALSISRSAKTLEKEFFIRLFVSGIEYRSDSQLYTPSNSFDLKGKQYFMILLSACPKTDHIATADLIRTKEFHSQTALQIEAYIGGIGHVIRKGFEELIVILDSSAVGDYRLLFNHVISLYNAACEQKEMLFTICASTQSYALPLLQALYSGCAKTLYKGVFDQKVMQDINWFDLKGQDPSPLFAISDEQKSAIITACHDCKEEQALAGLKALFIQTVNQNGSDNNAKNVFLATCKLLLVKSTRDQNYNFSEIFASLNAMNISLLLYRYLTECFTQVCTQNRSWQEGEVVDKNAGLKRKVLDYIQENLPNPDLSLKLIAADFGFAPTYFSALFKEMVGSNFSVYLDEKRMSLAKKLLLQDGLRIEDVGLQCGYTSVNSFRRAYKKCYGINPSQTREMVNFV